MNCPVCKHDGARRSRRQSFVDYLLSVAGVYPWRCESCRVRYHARLMPLSHSFYAHCPVCGNLELRRISPDYVNSLTAFVWKLLRVPAFRCDPCRYKYFSIRPLHSEQKDEVEVASGD